MVVGHVAFSPGTAVSGAVGAGLAPLAVAEAHRRQGVGAELTRAGLDTSRAAGFGWLVVLGEPSYKAGSVLRVEMVINDPETFRVRRQVKHEGESMTQWVPMRKGVANLFRYRDVSMAANSRYLEAFTVVDDPTPALRNLDRICERKRNRRGKSVRAFNPLAREDRQLFQPLLGGEHQVRGFSNR